MTPQDRSPSSGTGPAIGGISLPDSKLAREATELIRDVTDDLIYHHSRRVYLFGAHHGLQHGLDFDPELLYVEPASTTSASPRSSAPPGSASSSTAPTRPAPS